MAASMLSRLALQTARLTVVTIRQHTVHSAVPHRSFSVSSCIFGNKRFTEKHEWIEFRDKDKSSWATVGISDFAQEKLGEIVYVELPELGAKLAKEDSAGCVESVKAASDIYCPVGGEVVEVNSKLTDDPQLINRYPTDEGWLFKLDITDPAELEAVEELMDEAAYKKFIEET